MRISPVILAVSVFFFAGCATVDAGAAATRGATTAATVSPKTMVAAAVRAPTAPAVATASETASASASVTIPSTCSPDNHEAGLCVPSTAFVDGMCKFPRAGAALQMFGKGTPWTRTYLRVKDVSAWYSSGTQLQTPSTVRLDEELIVLRHRRASSNGIVFVGASGAVGHYDVLRWDGSCVSLEAEEVTMHRPPAPRAALVPWLRLDEHTRDVLSQDGKVQRAAVQVEAACDDASATCDKAKGFLTDVIAKDIREGKAQLALGTNGGR